MRSTRVSWAATTYAATALIAVGCSIAGLLDPAPILHFAVAAVAINAALLALVSSGINLRFRDPSMIGAQVVLFPWPTAYLMYHVTSPQARMPFLLMVVVAVLFGATLSDLRRMLAMGAAALTAHLALLTVLLDRAPERIDPGIELVILAAYAVTLVQVSFLGRVVARLRGSLEASNRELRESLRRQLELATRDPLTWLPNRRSVIRQLEREESRVQRRRPDQTTPCLCLLDIDGFQRINDLYGQKVGDAALREIGAVLVGTLRKGDFAGRFGGGEFLVLLPESSPAGAVRAAERVREAIRSLAIPGMGEGDRIDVSLGVAAHLSGESLEGTLARAERALRAAKAAGRGRVVLDQATPDLGP